MNTNVKFIPGGELGMIKGNRNSVWLKKKDIKPLTVHNYAKGRFVKVNRLSGYKMVNVDELYMKLFEPNKVSAKTAMSDTKISKSQLRNENNKGFYEPNPKARNPIISISGYVLRGVNRGKKLKQLPLKDILWYVDNNNLNYNELTAINDELSRREK